MLVVFLLSRLCFCLRNLGSLLRLVALIGLVGRGVHLVGVVIGLIVGLKSVALLISFLFVLLLAFVLGLFPLAILLLRAAGLVLLLGLRFRRQRRSLRRFRRLM